MKKLGSRQCVQTAMILAGGMGTRLRPVLADRQKVAAEVAGTPFIAYLLRQVEKAGVRKVILCAGYRAKSLETAVQGLFPRLEVKFSIEERPLGTGGALRLALKSCMENEFLVMNGDSFFDLDLNAFLAFSERASESVVISLRRMENVARYGMVRLLPSGKIARFEEKGTFQGAGWINAGIYRIRREVLEQIPEQTLCSLEREIFPRLAENGELAGYPAEGMFIDIGTPESFLEAQKLFEKGFVQ